MIRIDSYARGISIEKENKNSGQQGESQEVTMNENSPLHDLFPLFIRVAIVQLGTIDHKS